MEIEAKKTLLGKKSKDIPQGKVAKGRGDASYFRVSCKV